MRNPRDFFKPLAIDAPEPVREIPFKPSRMIHFLDFSNEKMVAKVPDIAPTVDILLGNLEDAVPVDRKLAARAGLIKVGREIDLGDTALWTRVNELASPWVLDDLTELVGEIGDKLEVIMIPKVEGPWDIHYVDRLLAQLEAKAGLERPILIHAILETAQGVANLEEIACASPRIQGMSFGPADLAASRRMKTTRVGGGHPGYRTIADPDPENPEAPRASYQQDPWHYSIARMVDACTSVGALPFYGPYGDIRDARGLRDAVPRVLPARLRRRVVAAPGADRDRQEGLLARPRRGRVRQKGDRGDPRRPRRAHDRRQDAGRRHLEAVQGDGQPRGNARAQGPGAGGGLRVHAEPPPYRLPRRMRFFEFEARELVKRAGIPVTDYGFTTDAGRGRRDRRAHRRAAR